MLSVHNLATSFPGLASSSRCVPFAIKGERCYLRFMEAGLGWSPHLAFSLLLSVDSYLFLEARQVFYVMNYNYLQD